MTASPLIVLQRAVLVHELLTAAAIPHALGGALALAYHVRQARATNDIDMNVTADPDEPERVLRLLPVPWTPADAAMVRTNGQVRLLWSHPDGLAPIPLDLFFPQHAFHDVVRRRAQLVPMLDAVVPILSATDLTVFKALFDRRKDWADIEELVRFGSVDLVEVRRWLAELVGSEDRRFGELAAVVADVGA